MTWSPKRGDIVNVTAGTKENRPGVVYRVDDVGAITVYHVAWGTGTDPGTRRKHGDPCDPCVTVERNSPDGDALALDKDTWFYPRERGTFEAHEMTPRPGVTALCPAEVLVSILALHHSKK